MSHSITLTDDYKLPTGVLRATGVQRRLLGPLRNFVYILEYPEGSVVIDPHADIKGWTPHLKGPLLAVLLTHTHHDHIGGMDWIFENTSSCIYMNDHELFRVGDWSKKYRDRIIYLNHNTLISSLDIIAWHTPGHSHGALSYAFFSTQTEAPQVCTGDTLFVHDCGRTDLPTGSNHAMFETLQRFKRLPDNTILLPGHDYGPTPTSTIGAERLYNPSFQCATVEELAALE